MSCKHPLKGFPIGTTEKGKTAYKVTPYEAHYVYKMMPQDDYKFSLIQARPRGAYSVIDEFIEIPCGKCIGCRLKYSRDWASRMMLEATQHEHNYFVTLTYDDPHLPINEFLIESTGETGFSPTLVKKDFQLFMKRLRSKLSDLGFEDHIKYYCAGEYGGATHRPHYHAILFGLPELELVPWKRTAQGYWLYNSPLLSSLWTSGFAVVGEVSFDTCAYVARYVTKKLASSVGDGMYEDYNFEPEFSLISTKPAIGREFFDRHKDELYSLDYFSLPTPDGAKKIFNSKYFDRLLEFESPDKYNEIKEKRKILSEAASRLRRAHSSQSYLEMLESEEKELKARTSSLTRKLGTAY